MIPAFDRRSGYLPVGIHGAGWLEFAKRFGGTSHRRLLLRGMKSALDLLKAAGSHTAYIGGSFVTTKTRPRDFDGCWDEATVVDWSLVDPIFLPRPMPPHGLFMIDKHGQWLRFRGELYPAGSLAEELGAPI